MISLYVGLIIDNTVPTLLKCMLADLFSRDERWI